jgi:hypothetical protein
VEIISPILRGCPSIFIWSTKGAIQALIAPGAFDDHIIHRAAGVGALVPDPVAFIIGDPANDHLGLAVVIVEIIGCIGRAQFLAAPVFTVFVAYFLAAIFMSCAYFLASFRPFFRRNFRKRAWLGRPCRRLC